MANQFMTISLHVFHNEISSTPVKEIYVYIALCSYCMVWGMYYMQEATYSKLYMYW